MGAARCSEVLVATLFATGVLFRLHAQHVVPDEADTGKYDYRSQGQANPEVPDRSADHGLETIGWSGGTNGLRSADLAITVKVGQEALLDP
jgi:hypothetical protein